MTKSEVKELGFEPPGVRSKMLLCPMPGGGTPIHYLYGYVPSNGVVILKLLI